MKYILGLIFLMPAFFLQAQAKEGFAENQGARIHYKVYGTGRPVLVANGGPGYSSENMEELAQKLSTYNLQVILFDQRGTGKSVLPKVDSTTLSFDLLLSDMAAIADATGNKMISVMGHSFGGMLAMGFAQKYPARIYKLVLCSSAGIDLDFISYFGDNIAQRLPVVPEDSTAKPPVTYQERIDAFFRMVTRNAPAYLFDKTHTRILVEMLTLPGSYNPDFNDVIWADLFRNKYDLSKKFGKFKNPVLVVQGRQDIIGEETALRIHEAFSTSKLVFIDRCGHVPWLDQPGVFFETLAHFFESR